tara:strand:- start:7002 stop:7838 length:837 start_codon:yes stop_codon:yes gene_type:complete
MKNICASCQGVDVKSIIKTNNEKLPSWLQKTDYVSNFIENAKIKPYTQKKTNMKLNLNAGKQHKNKFILYWGAEPSSTILIKDAKKAYKNFKNYGVTLVNKDGLAPLHFNCPQPYNTIEKGKKQKETFYRHIHFCFSNKAKTTWNETVYTKVIVCNLNLKQTMDIHKKQNAVLINSLPAKYYAKSHILNSFNLTSKDIKKMSQNDLMKWFTDVIAANYLKLNNLIKQKKLDIYEVPIIVYCAHDKCNAGELAAIELLKKGFVNIMDFKGGMKDYLKSK